MAENLRKDFSTVEEAFSALPQSVQEHSRRVENYMRILFLQACSDEIHAKNPKVSVRLKEEYRDLAAEMGRLHDIGKVLVPAEYHRQQENFSPEEIALYQKHPLDSAKLLKSIFSASKQYSAQEIGFFEEALSGHHERWNGAGFPGKANGDAISIFARLIAVADALDHFSAEKHSEQPFEYAVEQIQARAKTMFDPAVTGLLKGAKTKLKRAFSENISQTLAIPETEKTFRHTQYRPFGMWYRPIGARKKDDVAAYEGVLRFRNKSAWQEYDELEAIIRREKLTQDIGVYMLLETCDTIKRMDACSVPVEFITLQLPSLWLNQRGAWREVESACKDTEVSPERLCILVGERSWAARTKTMTENLTKLRSLGCRTMLSALEASAEDAKASAFSDYRVTAAMLDSEGGIHKLQKIAESGVIMQGEEVEKQRYQKDLNLLGVNLVAGALYGEYQQENDLIEQALLQQETGEKK